MKMAPPCPDPVISCVNPASNLGAVSENFEELIDSYLRENPDGVSGFKSFFYFINNQ